MRRLALALLVTLILPACAPARAPLEVRDGWVRALPPGAPNTAAFMTLLHHGTGPLALVGAESPVARVAELHTMAGPAGRMEMRPVEAIELPANGDVKLAPGGRHLMLIDLRAPLRAGDIVPVTLVFSDSQRLTVRLPVRDR